MVPVTEDEIEEKEVSSIVGTVRSFDPFGIPGNYMHKSG